MVDRTPPILSDIQKIAVLRANALGDLVFALPALTALRETYPQAEIVLLAREWHDHFLSQRHCWPPEQFAAVGDALADRGYTVLVTGTAAERKLVEAVVQQMGAKAHNLCGRLSLNGLTGLLSRCALLIANDTGPLHVAAAVGTATIGIYWCGNVITAGPLERKRHRPLSSWRLQCPVCGVDCTHDRCAHQESFVADVPVRAVIEAAYDLLTP